MESTGVPLSYPRLLHLHSLPEFLDLMDFLLLGLGHQNEGLLEHLRASLVRGLGVLLHSLVNFLDLIAQDADFLIDVVDLLVQLIH